MDNVEKYLFGNIDQDLNNYSVILMRLFLAGFLGALIGFHFVKFGKTFSGRAQLARVFPMLAMTIFVIISVVKASLALSLGLVGALSIVRFRTPIKEPEELVYLFMAIAVGLGLGAGHELFTVVVVILILVVHYLISLSRGDASRKYSMLCIEYKNTDASGENVSDEILNTVAKIDGRYDLKNMSKSENTSFMDFTLVVKNADTIQNVYRELISIPDVTQVRFLDSSKIPGV